MFCPECGKEIDSSSTVCPECGASVVKYKEPVKRKPELDPLVMVSVVFAIISFLFGFILITCSLAKRGSGIGLIEMIIIMPAFVGLGTGVYKLFDRSANKLSKLLAVGSVLLTALILFYAFIAFAVIIT